MRELEIAHAYALGELLGTIDAILTLESVGFLDFDSEDFEQLRIKRDAYDKAAQAYLDARLAA